MRTMIWMTLRIKKSTTSKNQIQTIRQRERKSKLLNLSTNPRQEVSIMVKTKKRQTRLQIILLGGVPED
jgi:hypothetical protein